jgi:hypothetical protein
VTLFVSTIFFWGFKRLLGKKKIFDQIKIEIHFFKREKNPFGCFCVSVKGFFFGLKKLGFPQTKIKNRVGSK